MKSLLKYFMLFVTSGVVCLSSTVATTASAWETRIHAWACTTLGGVTIDGGFGIQNDGATTMVVLCPARDETSTDKQSTTVVNLVGLDDSTVGVVSAGQCVASAFVSGGACGPTLSTPFGATGNYLLSLPVAGFWNSTTVTDFGYVFIKLPPKQGAFRSSFRGMYQAGI